MTQSETFRFKLLMGVYAIAAAVGGSTNPLAWNVYGQGIAVITLLVLINYQYRMYKIEEAIRESSRGGGDA